MYIYSMHANTFEFYILAKCSKSHFELPTFHLTDTLLQEDINEANELSPLSKSTRHSHLPRASVNPLTPRLPPASILCIIHTSIICL